MFSKTEEPLDADDWLQTMENNLEVAGVEAAEKVLFATHYLAGPARAWWTSTRAMNAGQIMTWADFKLKFSKYHVPPGLIKKMRDEFRELKQASITSRNQHREVSPIKQSRSNPNVTTMCSGGDGGDDDEDDGDDDGDDVQLDDDDDGVDFPLRENFPVDFSLPESSFLSGVRPARRL
ncbi:hypothetical protein QYE76_003309 [Lolium multiflorum]|uniref:Retrotransposon gag domain-containing protein n=1 Tax=Lolium multiflorum TaxID=4521 RepID=A0AAD8RPX0_LOLMU|nr:hypothetical protein QYE76_003309 [Lolium multiflorum]